ncbi:MAG: transporter substrate-binding domain-containing protein [Xanthomonadales bacterium]|nr:transporter substrate-binding domain-containing protein [Xanthomonadales bacterium]
MKPLLAGPAKALVFASVLFLAAATAEADTLVLGNEPWPPFIIEGEAAGTAEAIVCEALERGGRSCDVRYAPWPETLAAARSGELDGVAAAWYTVERGRSLQYSQSYLTNRLIPVTRSGHGAVGSLADLAGQRVALEVAFAYGDGLLAARDSFTVVDVRGADEALAALRAGEADIAIVDELTARDALKGSDLTADGALVPGNVALAFRELHFAVSRERPDAGQIIADFNLAYQAMLRDGTVNRILGLEWLATDLESDGVMDFIHRGGGLQAAVSDAASRESVYALSQEEYDAIRDPGFQGSNVNYLSDDQAYQTPEAAMKSLEPGKRCRYDSRTAHMICSGR